MLEEGKALINLLVKRGFKAFYIGGKPRNDLFNSSLVDEPKIKVDDIDILTTASQDELKKIFPTAKEETLPFPVMKVNFADIEFEISSYQDSPKLDKLADNYGISIRGKMKETPELRTLDINRSLRDFTVNTIIQDKQNRFVDFCYTYNGEKISALQDLNARIIRAVKNPDDVFTKDPIRILRMVALVSIFGFSIDNATFEAAVSHKDMLRTVPIKEINVEFHKTLFGRHVDSAFKIMKKMKLFGTIMNNNKPFLPMLQKTTKEKVDALRTYNINGGEQNIIDAYTILFENEDKDEIIENMQNSKICNISTIMKVIWILRHYHTLKYSEHLYEDIYKAKDELIQKIGQSGMTKLIKRMCVIEKCTNPSSDRHIEIYRAYCERPYFIYQLRVTKDDIRSYIEEETTDEQITEIMEHIVQRLVKADVFPYSYNDYMQMVADSIHDVFKDSVVSIPKEKIKIDKYGNAMDPQRACQYDWIDTDTDLI